jgi:hypothetical protein
MPINTTIRCSLQAITYFYYKKPINKKVNTMYPDAVKTI